MRLFISYSRDDKDTVYDLASQLREEGQHEVWIDKRLVGGDEWWTTICTEIGNADCFIYVLTPKSLSSIYCQGELDYARQCNLPVLPLKLKACEIPEGLSPIQVSDLEGQTRETKLFRTDQALGKIQRRLDRGDFPKTNPLPNHPKPPEPTLDRDQLLDELTRAELATAYKDWALAEKIYQMIIKKDPDDLGRLAAELLAENQAVQKREDAYQRIVNLASNPATVRVARAQWTLYVKDYGLEYDERGFQNDDRFKTKPPLPPRVPDSIPESEPTPQAIIQVSPPPLAPVLTPQPPPITPAPQNPTGSTQTQASPSPIALPSNTESPNNFRIGWVATFIGVVALLGLIGGLLPTLGNIIAPSPTFTRLPTSTSLPTLPPHTLVPTLIPTPLITAGTVRIDSKGVKQVYVPPGTFKMGSNDSDDEKPIHEVRFTEGFWIDQFEVTNLAWDAFVDAGGYRDDRNWSAEGLAWRGSKTNRDTSGCTPYSSDPQQPAICVTWYEAEAYAAWRGGVLPTEAQWEYAARGPQSFVYPWGNTFNGENVVYRDNSGSKTAPVGSRPNGKSWVNAYDLSGNVWEWVRDYYSSSYYESLCGSKTVCSKVIDNPFNGNRADYRGLRGGSWLFTTDGVRSAYRRQLLAD
jgi:formylglycine-generating enzyme required for sulfatase activity